MVVHSTVIRPLGLGEDTLVAGEPPLLFAVKQLERPILLHRFYQSGFPFVARVEAVGEGGILDIEWLITIPGLQSVGRPGALQLARRLRRVQPGDGYREQE